MANAEIQIEITALDNATSALKKIDRNLAPIKKKVGGVEKEFKQS